MVSRRFETTTATGLEAIVARRGELEDRGVIAEKVSLGTKAGRRTLHYRVELFPGWWFLAVETQ